MCDSNVMVKISENEEDNKDKLVFRSKEDLAGAALIIILLGIFVCFIPIPGPSCHDRGEKKLTALNNTVNKVSIEF